MKGNKEPTDKFHRLRARAMDLQAEFNESGSALASDDVVMLVHELNTYQIELELQNEDLRQSQIELEQSRRRFNDLYDFAPIGYLTISDKGQIIEANLTAAELFGVTRGHLLKKSLASLVAKEDQNCYYHYHKDLLKQGGSSSCELRMHKKDKTLFYVQIKAAVNPGLDGSGNQVRAALLDITQRKQQEQRLQAEELRYRTLADYTYDWEFWINQDSNFVYVSPSCERITGYRADEFYNNSSLLEEIVHPEDRELFRNHRCWATDRSLVPNLDFRIISRTGDVRWIGQTCQEVYDQAGELAGCRGSNRDISTQKKLEADLQRLKERYRSIVMDQYDLICRFDTLGRITFVNDAYCDCFSVKYYEILGTNFIPNIYTEDLPLVQDHFKRLTPAQPAKLIDIRVVLANGEIHWQQWTGRAFFDQQGKAIEYQAVGRDITTLKEAEQKLRDEIKMRQLFMDSLPGVAMLLKYDTREVVAANKAAAAVGAVPGAQCYRTWGQRETPCPGCAAKKLWASWQTQHEQFWRRGIFWDAHWVPVGNDLYLHYAFDMTEMEHAKQELQKAHDTLEYRVEERTLDLKNLHKKLVHIEKLSAIGRLSASIAHEFNNPLQGVMTIVKIVENHTSLTKDEKELVGLAVQECQRMKDLIVSLQDFNRPSSGISAPVNVPATIDALLLIGKKEFKNRKIQIEKRYAENLPLIMAVPDQLKQVFLNLLNNAIFACENGGKIIIKTEQAGEHVIVDFQDNGIDIDPENMPHIFEPFFTTKPAVKGTGLGLSVSYGIIKKHGGEINVTSELGKGATFSVTLPIEGQYSE
jgi:PAS domain S-box-containing protein